MRVLRILGLAIMLGIMTTSMALAKEQKLAYVDLAKVFDNYQKTKDFDAILQKEGEQFQKDRDGMVAKIRDEQSKLSLMSDSEKTKMQANIEKDKNDVIAFDREKRMELAKRRDNKVREILAEIQKSVAAIAQRQGITFVLNDKVLIYADQTTDITAEVMKSLNETAP